MERTELSQSQMGIWYACQGQDGAANYQCAIIFELPAEIDIKRLKAAAESVVKAHPYLYSHVVETPDGPMIETDADAAASWQMPVIDIDSIDTVMPELGAPMDLSSGEPLFKLTVYRTNASAWFYVDVNHLIFDGTSNGVFIAELERAYNGEPLMGEQITGGQIAAAEKALRESPEWQAQHDWYIEKMAPYIDLESLPVPTAMDIESDAARNIGSAVKQNVNEGYGTIETDFRIPVKSEVIEGLAAKCGVKESMVFTAAWGKLLADWTAQDKAIFSTIYNGRNDIRTRQSITMMVRTLPVGMDLKQDTPIADWIKYVSDTQKAMREKSAFSFADLHQELGLHADSLFAYHGKIAPSTMHPLRLGGLTISGRDLRVARPGTMLDGQMFRADGCNAESDYTLRISYKADTYSAAMVASVAESYAAILHSMATAATIADIEPASDSQHTWLDGLNPSELPLDFAEKSMTQLFRENVMKRPNSECCVSAGNRYSYAEVDRITDSLAAKILELVHAEDGTVPVVSFIIPRGELMVFVPLAIVKAGCTYQPLDSSYPSERLSFMVDNASAALLICTESLSGKIEGYAGPVLTIPDASDFKSREWNAPADLSGAREMEADDTLLLLYTSGTTGTPKGVMLSNGNVLAFCKYHNNNVGLTADCRMASYASYGFDAFMMDLWSAMTSGAALHIIYDEIRFDLPAIAEYVEREQISHLFMTTQVGTQMALDYPDLKSLKVLSLGGEKLMSIAPPKYRLINMYGPTETTCYITDYDVVSQEKNIPIGSADGNSPLYIVNASGKRLPMGAAGELWISGTQVSKGYLGLPEKTAAAFIDNPFAGGAASKVYRSGDVVRYREDGQIEFIGRQDGQVKIRGFRIELKEVEAIIREFPGVSEVTVQAFEPEAGGKAIAAYITGPETIDIKALESFILEQKPPYMVPAVTMQIDAIPLNVNGKVDRRALPKPVITVETDADSAPAAPLNRLEQQLMDIIAPLAGTDSFSITTPLSYVGLTSISSIKLATQLFKKFGINIPNRDLVSGATLQSIENAILEKLLEADATAEMAPDGMTGNMNGAKASDGASASNEKQPIPLTFAQTGVFIECLKNPESTVYNIPFIIRFPEDVTAERIAQAFNEVAALHPILAARFDDSVDPAVQTIDPALMPKAVISDVPAEQLEKDYVQPFDLMAGPLCRATVSGSTLLIDVHHLVMDGSSMAVLVQQMCQRLDGVEIEAEQLSYAEHSRMESQADTTAAQAWFKEQLQTVSESTSLPADLHGKEHEGRQAECSIEIDHAPVEQFARRQGLTPASVYLAATEYTAARFANTRDVCICTVSAGRSDIRLSQTVGMFVNTLALASHITDCSTGDYIKAVSDSLSHTLEHENWPFARVAQDYGLSADLMFIYQLGVLEEYKVGGKAVTFQEMELSAPKAKLSLQVVERDGKVIIVAQYNDALYSAKLVNRMLDSLRQVITNMISAPEAPIKSLSILSASQLAELEPMRAPFKADMPVRLFHAGMERWAVSQPEHTAIIAVDATLSYKEFNETANRIANALIAKGLKKGDAVVVLLPRRSTTICCIFGIMKAGGAYIPCDPEYPTERIRLIAEDSGAPYVVTTPDLVAGYAERGLVIDELLECNDISQPDVQIDKDDLAYYIYTSGSTGRPKGVRVAHGNITTFLTASPEYTMLPIMAEAERLCSVSTISFDASICEYGMSLFNGRTFIFSSEQQSKDPIALVELMKRTDADYFGCTSSRMLQYLELPEFVECIKRCKVLMQGGEKFQDILLEKLHTITKAHILNAYGPTEVGIGCNSADLKDTNVISVGKPSPNYTEWILDLDGNELPVGVTGELCVGGPGITQGYNNLPEKTAEKFITYGGMRAFKTGDYARWMENGEIEILGRTDNQVKLRGLRIELSEVEGAISQYPGVKNVLVKICNIQGRDHLSAYFIAEQQVDIAQLKASIGKTLTAYMVPTAYLQMDAFPITPNGKTDFRALPQPCLAQSANDYVAPKTDAEKFFAGTFAEILQLERVGATDSFFELGGTSLVVMKVVICAQKAGYKVTYADVFDNPTPRTLGALASASDGAAKSADPDADVRDFDYAEIDKLLKDNSIEGLRTAVAEGFVKRPLGNVLLTGATGFLGIHVLRNLLDNYPDTEIHCLLRPKANISAQERLQQLMFYYFERNCKTEMDRRIFVHEGDVTSDINIDAHIDTVINCAALVKHFAKGTEIEDINVGGVSRCIDFALAKGARLIQISTYSVAGASVNGEPAVKAYTENMLFLGQRIRNQYVHSKIMGERLILDAVCHRGLDAKIMRVGNLSARSEDGEFQINLKANSFMGRLGIYRMLGALPYSEYQSPVEFSPIDETAAAICLLAQTSRQFTVFHPYNSHYQMLGDVLARMGRLGTEVRLVEDSRFMEILESAKADASKQEQLSAMLAYENHDSGEFVQMIPADNSFTHQVLLRLGFKWSLVSSDYVDRFLQLNDTRIG